MRVFLIALLTIHGLIHLMGPARAFGWAELPDLRLAISAGAGVAWLVAAVLFIGSAVLIALEKPFPAREWWWVMTLPALALSQVLIAQSWHAAKFGTLPNLMILVPAIVSALNAMPGSYRSTYHHEVSARLEAQPVAPPVVTDVDLAVVPLVVQRYLRHVGVVGRPRVRNLRIRFVGAIRNDGSSAWMHGNIEQYSFFGPDARFFIMGARRGGLPIEALHVFKGPHAMFEVKLAAVARLVDARGPEMDQSETVTMLNDMCMFAPAALLDANIAWSEIGEKSVRATFSREGQAVSALLAFGDDGALVNFVSEDRYRTDGKIHERATWSTPVSQYGVVDGFTVPVIADARWKTANDDFSYARFEITSLNYNLPLTRSTR